MSLISCEDCWICCEPCAAKCMHPDREEQARATGPNWTCNRRFPEDIPPPVEAMWKDLVIEQVERAQDKRDHEAALKAARAKTLEEVADALGPLQTGACEMCIVKCRNRIYELRDREPG